MGDGHKEHVLGALPRKVSLDGANAEVSLSRWFVTRSKEKWKSMGKTVTVVRRPRTPTPAEVEAAGAWDQVAKNTIVFDFAEMAKRTSASSEPWSETESSGLREAIQRWLAKQM